MPGSRFCFYCEHRWPYASDYKICPICDEATHSQFGDERPMLPSQALITIEQHEQQVKRYEDFEEYYYERERKALLNDLDSFTASA